MELAFLRHNKLTVWLTSAPQSFHSCPRGAQPALGRPGVGLSFSFTYFAHPMNAPDRTLRSPSASSAVRELAVQVQKSSVVYPSADARVWALHEVDLDIAPGEFVSLIGPSGCGKTTLLRVIADLEPITAGTVRVNGLSPHEARLARAYGYVFQSPALFPWRTVLANVMLPLQIQGRSAEECKAVALEQLGRVGLTGFERKYPWQLRAACSSGCRSHARSASSRGS